MIIPRSFQGPGPAVSQSGMLWLIGAQPTVDFQLLNNKAIQDTGAHVYTTTGAAIWRTLQYNVV